jgi:hypothetical protein
MRKLKSLILTSLVEGNSVAATCRMFRASKVTVLRLPADAGTLADVALEALESYRARCGARFQTVPEYARVCRVEKAIRRYLEAMACLG